MARDRPWSALADPARLSPSPGEAPNPAQTLSSNEGRPGGTTIRHLQGPEKSVSATAADACLAHLSTILLWIALAQLKGVELEELPKHEGSAQHSEEIYGEP